MANSTKCLTDGAIYKTAITNMRVSATVELPFILDISEQEAEILETLIHNQLETLLRPYFILNEVKKQITGRQENK
jgi:hypothetical protein